MSFAKGMGIEYPILVGKESETDAVANAYGGVPFLPETFFISRDGIIVGKILGLKSKSDIEDSIKMALGSATKTPAQVAQSSELTDRFWVSGPRAFARGVQLKRDPVMLIVLAMLASVLLVYGFSSALNGHALSPEELAAVKMRGQTAHDFQLKTTTGNTIHLADLRGRAVVLNFWSTTCEPCKVEMPWLAELQKQYGPQGLQILGMAYDPSDVEDIAGYSKDMGIDYPILVGAERRNSRRSPIVTAASRFSPRRFISGATAGWSKRPLD